MHNQFILMNSMPQQLSNSFNEGVTWGVQVGTATLGFMLIAGVLSNFVRSSK